jgi:hypothetical protein
MADLNKTRERPKDQFRDRIDSVHAGTPGVQAHAEWTRKRDGTGAVGPLLRG